MKPVFTQDVESSVEHIVESEAFLNTLLRLQHAASLNLGLSLVSVHRIEVGMAAQDAPPNLFPDVVNPGLRLDFHLIGSFGLHTTDHLPGRNDEGMITPWTDPRGVFATCHRGAEQRPG